MTDDNQAEPGETGFRKPVLDAALRLAGAGYPVFPCKRWEKVPATRRGFHDATTDQDQVIKWFDNDMGFNLAIATGDGLLVVDVDPKNGGAESWAELCAEHGTPLAPRHETPSGGFHLFFNAPGLPSSVKRIGKGIDTRGDGGYVVVPPSKLHDSNGEIIRYRWSRETALVTNAPTLLPDWVRALLEQDPPPPRATRDFVMTEWNAPDALRAWWSWDRELPFDGWQPERMSGGDQHWVRPGKDIRDGKSATVHPSGVLVVWTSERPQGGVPTRGADGVSFSPWDYCVAYRFSGDGKACRAWVAGLLGPTPDVARAAPITPTAMNLPPEFWLERGVLTQIRNAAWNRVASPDALLAHVLARTATLVPPTYKLPAAVGGMQTLDFIGCVIAETSGGKSMSAAVAREFMPDPAREVPFEERQVMFDMPIGSGEGISQAFMVPEQRPDEEGKMVKTGKQVVGKQGLHLVVDEGTGFTSMAGRAGTTVVATLASAWSGESLGNLNADDKTRRLIDGGRVRVCCVINMQTSNGHLLFTDELASVGFTGRLLFASAHVDQATTPALDDLPSWPGEFRFPVPPGYGLTQQVFVYDPAITREIREVRYAVLTQAADIDKKRSQYLLLQCKVAALFAVWDGRLEVSLDDWRLAATVVEVSSENLDHLDSVHRQQEDVTTVTAIERRLNLTHKATQRHVQQLAAGWRAKVIARLRKKGPLAWKGLKDIVDADRRVDLRSEIEAMVDDGTLVMDGARYALS